MLITHTNWKEYHSKNLHSSSFHISLANIVFCHFYRKPITLTNLRKYLAKNTPFQQSNCYSTNLPWSKKRSAHLCKILQNMWQKQGSNTHLLTIVSICGSPSTHSKDKISSIESGRFKYFSNCFISPSITSGKKELNQLLMKQADHIISTHAISITPN